MASTTSFCPNCGHPLQPQTSFCANCGTKIASQTHNPPIQQSSPAYYPPVPAQQPPVSTGAYKAVIAVLLVIIVLLGIGLYATSSGHPFSLGTYRYSIPNPPNSQSIQPPTTPTPSPTTTIWNSCGSGNGCTMSQSGWREGTVPDTYDYFVSFTSNVSITVYFLTLGQFVQFAVCNGDLSCVSGSYRYLQGATSYQNAVFKLGEGCADYVAIYVSSGSGVMQPDVKVANNPAPYATGYCAQVGS